MGHTEQGVQFQKLEQIQSLGVQTDNMVTDTFSMMRLTIRGLTES